MPVDQIFSIVNQKPTPHRDDLVVDVVHFSPMITPPAGQSPWFTGWYLVVKHDGFAVWHYYLSNAHEK